MEHLPFVKNPYEPISIPYLGGPEYDGLEFADYPARRFGGNFLFPKLLTGDLQGKTELEIAQFLQTWLFFGMIYEAYRLSEDHFVDQRSLVRVDPVTTVEYITTVGLPRLFDIWRDSLKYIPRDSKEFVQYYERYRASMVTACSVYRKLMAQSEIKGATPLLSHEILLSIQILGAAIDIGVTEVCSNNAKYTWRVVPRSGWLMERMISQGWCPCIVEQISSPCTTFLYYASLLGPPTLGKDHSNCRSNSRACVAANVKDNVKYVSRHVEDGCECEFVVIDTGPDSKISLSISRGELPLIQLSSENENGDVTVDVASYSEDDPIPYIAISHVWSDGLGDPVGNRLPRCQINRMAKLLKALPQHTEDDETNLADTTSSRNKKIFTGCYFWMDTLCIPKDILLRHQAINRMSSVYSSAAQVLVLTLELMKHPSIGVSYTEIFTRISCSTWLRRLWTLQEAALNANLLFQFSDQAVYTNQRSSMYAQQLQENKEKPWDLVRWECNRYHFLDANEVTNASYTMRVNNIWNNLQHRTTSRGGDEPLCIAILLSLDLEKLQEEPDACTVKKFWRLHEEHGVPKNVLIIPGPKLDEDGLHWAASELMDLKIMGSNILAHADVTPRGLLATWPGVVLDKLDHQVKSVIPIEVDEDHFFVRQVLMNNSPSWEGLELRERGTLAVLLVMIVCGEHAAVDGLEASLGALVEVITSGEIMYVQYLRLVSVSRKDSHYDQHPNIPWRSEEIEEKMLTPVKGKFMKAQQKWCVG